MPNSIKHIIPIAFIVLFFSQCQSKKSNSNETSDEIRTIGSIEKLDDSLDKILSDDAKVEVLAEGFGWSEGPVWVPSLNSLLFSDVPANTIYQWNEKDGNSTYLSPSGYTGIAPASEGEGANGLALDNDGNLLICQHGDRRLAMIFKDQLVQPDPDINSIVDNYDGRRFNSPNDVLVTSNGEIYFTDPPYGLKDHDADSLKELAFNGVYKLAIDGKLTLLIDDLSRPNGLALSPDEQTLYVANSDPKKALWMAYDVTPTGLENGRVFFDATDKVDSYEGLPDGLKINKEGIVFATGPGGVYVFSPEGKHLGMIYTELTSANCALNEDQSVLYMTTHKYLTRVKLN